MSDWHPISTAPKTQDDPDVSCGPIVVLASLYGHRAVGYWGRGVDSREGWVNPHDHLVMDYWNSFTHWMPLPPPPQERTP